MPFPARMLNDGERVVVHTRTHVKALIGPALLLIVLAALAGWVSSLVYGNAGAAQPLVQGVVWVLALAAAGWWVGRPFLRWLTTTCTFTDRRLVVRSGLLARQGRTIPLDRISGIAVDVGILDRVFGCGTLLVSDASEGGAVRLHDIPYVDRVQLQVAEQLHRQARESREGRPAHDDGT